MKYYPIPGTVGFKTSDDGRVFDPNDKELNTYLNEEGYLRAQVKYIKGGWRTDGVHRLVALSQLPIPDNHEDLEVNHLDLDTANNRRTNLEWVTTQENNIHATLFREDLKRPLVLALGPDGKYRYFRNIQEIERELGFDRIEVWRAIKDNLPLNGWQFAHNRFDASKPKELHLQRIKRPDGIGTIPKRSIVVLDTDTDQLTTYESFKEAAKVLDTGLSSLHQCINRDNTDILKLFRKRYLVAYEDIGLPEFTQDQLREAKGRGKKDVIVYNENLNSIEIYGSAVEFYKKYGLSKKAVTTTLRSGKLRKIDGLIFTYFTKENVLKLKPHIKRPGKVCASKALAIKAA